MRLDRERSSFEGRGGCSPAGFGWVLGGLWAGSAGATCLEHSIAVCSASTASSVGACSGFCQFWDPGRDFLYRRMASEARGDLFVKATCLENSDQSLTLFLTE